MAMASRGVGAGAAQGAAAGSMMGPGWGTVIGAGIGAAASMIGSQQASKQRKRELAEEKAMKERELGLKGRELFMEKEGEGSDREAIALNNVIEGLRKSLRR